jgi:hypothetical protein
MVEVGLCDPHTRPDEVARLAQAPEYAADEIRAALVWTRNAASREYYFAETLLTRLPAVFTALDTGVICRSKAWLFTELCAELTDEQIQAVQDRDVIGYLDADGTAAVTGHRLPAEQAAAACARIEDLARPRNAPGILGESAPVG